MFSNASLWGALTPINSGLPSQIPLGGNVKRGGYAMEDLEDDGEFKLKSRQSSTERSLYITVTACKQPTSNTTTDLPPQLSLYVSQSQGNTSPGPGQSPQVEIPLVGGYALYEVNATGNVYIGVYGENVSTTYTGVWDAQVAASIDQPYHYFWNSSDPNLFSGDSDSNSALLYTDYLMSNYSDLTLVEKWMDMSPPFTIFANGANDTSIMGVQNSYCGLHAAAQISANTTKMANISGLPKQQFYVNGLDPGTTYNVALAMNGTTASGNSAVGAGGQVFKMTSFTTLSTTSCAVITDLQFCDQVAYAVPANPSVFNDSTLLASSYDQNVSASYSVFQQVMALTPCNTTSSAKYSLARGCDDCVSAYKLWLCAVMIPRCTDFSSTQPWLQERAITQNFTNGTSLDPSAVPDFAINSQRLAFNSSRNPLIDAWMPGPYKEVLPCADLCYKLVQSCPASMGFYCPQPGVIGFNTSYGVLPQGGANVDITNMTCNYPGMVHVAAGGKIAPSLGLVLLTAVLGVTMMS